MATLGELMPGAEFVLKRNGIRYKLVKIKPANGIGPQFLCERDGRGGLVVIHPQTHVDEVSYGFI